MLAAEYPLLDVVWTMAIFFLWILWFWLLFSIWTDLFRRDDLSGWGKAGWLIFTIVLPFLGAFVYLVSQNKGMTERTLQRAKADRARFDDHVREAAESGGAAAEIEKAKALLDSGALTQEEFDLLKRKALA